MTGFRYRDVNAAPRAAFLYPRLAIGLLLSLGLAACEPTPMPGPVAQPPVAKGPPRSIGDVQGPAARSPYEGQTVTVQGVVTGNFVSGLEGFFMQDASGAEDGDRATSDGLFVSWKRDAQPKVRRGERLSVTGRVVELGARAPTLTALVDARIEVLGRAAVQATTLSRAPARAADWEALEGMWLRLPGPLVISGNANLSRFGELHMAFGERLRAPTDIASPGAKAQAVEDENRRRGLIIDDARGSEYPNRLWFLDPPLSNENPLRAGSLVYGVEGVLDARHGSWRLQLTEKLGRIEQAPRPAMPVLPKGLRLVSYNLGNLFNGNGRGGGFPTERGASSRQEYQRQRDKHVAVLAALQPDIAALSEVENEPLDERSALGDLVAALNRALGEAGDYRAVVGDSPGGPIQVALIYRAGRVGVEGEAVTLTTGPFAHGSRPPLAQGFIDFPSGRQLTVVANHFKSKGSCPESGNGEAGDLDAADGQGCWNAKRVASARALDLWMKSDPTGIDTPHRVLLGDFNAYTREDPLRLLRSLGWRDALPIRGEDLRHHSFVFNGQAGSLDHALVSPSLAGAITAALVWQINSDEAEVFDYNLERRPADLYRAEPFATSDHDPLVMVLDLERAAQ
ncbi:ExeM/NucH family extracellular endonuclease [Pseudomarimonas salicorniae]|uniref:ExeM/NucH family extracellular endonuclease n=1 Tax=Pseudomarimonas salicorniae TaxID=2933270 RepID=A0ABT0GCZ8_9GAMM|nr:ExeM/NucH family extracellular endonuclease [Lysobacter sp. CAU 1642]MCK7592419.1 ExeM/NucH family extracellular endonuclease [Lysobacter sp. CAU 1642]